jgi:hypothetical protein
MEELRSLIALLVEAYVSSLPPKSAIINPNAKKVTITQPRLGLTAKKPSPPAPAKSSSPRGLSDSDLIATLDRYGIDRKNATDMLAHDTDLRRDLKLDDPKLKNTDYSRRVYAAATKRS